MIKFKMIYLMALLMVLGMCGIGMSAVSTGATGYNMMVLIDEVQLDALGPNPVLFYNSTTKRIEGDDAFAGGILAVPTMNGSILFGNLAGGTFDETTTTAGANEILWDDTNKSLGIGADSAATTPYSYLVVRDDTLDVATGYTGTYLKINKTAGATNMMHGITGLGVYTTFNQNGGVIGNLDGVSSLVTLIDGTVGADIGGLRGWASGVTLTGGVVTDDVKGASVNVNQGAGNTVNGDLVGLDVGVTTAGTVTGNVISFRQQGTTVKPFVTLTLAVPNGQNANLALPNGTNFLCSNATGVFSITGLTGGVDGRMITIYNSAAQDMVISNENVGSTAANRITTTTGADMSTTAAGCVSLIYNGVTSRWLLIDMEV